MDKVLQRTNPQLTGDTQLAALYEEGRNPAEQPITPADPDQPVGIDDPEEPLSEAPKTGDTRALWIALASISAADLVWLLLDSKRRKAEKRSE